MDEWSRVDCKLELAIAGLENPKVLRVSDLKKQGQYYRSVFRVLRIAKWNLKKQSQFEPVQIGVKCYLEEAYGNIPTKGARKNKANQSQFHAPTQPAKEQKTKKWQSIGCLLTRLWLFTNRQTGGIIP